MNADGIRVVEVFHLSASDILMTDEDVLVGRGSRTILVLVDSAANTVRIEVLRRRMTGNRVLNQFAYDVAPLDRGDLARLRGAIESGIAMIPRSSANGGLRS